MSGRVWHANDGFVADIPGYGTVILPGAFCDEHGIETMQDAADHVVKDLAARGRRVMIEVKEGPC